MRVLRANKDSVMAMLEAFVHDPLINWRLLNHADADAPEHPDTARASRCLSHYPCAFIRHHTMLGVALVCIMEER